MKPRGRPAKIQTADIEIVRELALSKPLATVAELMEAFQERTGIAVHAATVSKAFFWRGAGASSCAMIDLPTIRKPGFGWLKLGFWLDG